MLSKKDVRHIAKLSRLKLSEEEVEKFSKELTSILDYIDILNELDTDNVEPTAQVTGLTNVFREDKVLEPESSKEDLLNCSPLPIANDQIETFSAHG
ncbi:Asp-tRNA(Asn)/Glu-tRNA(Gln) amidotransferase subunit GatC [Candidatus Peribacteria bacterium]|jgi:aspartyl-tRNA(Asn)/glutamyl-tRNA(Gln) amidotransferase subunit C|nr:Asp-tRNA(Asn)/Glu-tRNA(Gln) amidotransferase subunit GatC [Candidatus Peribacteria bacterium]MBT4240533.1 Asp-tRNA(Asn)/Glu-tRNA(Gln) amidotransferase subunit GatC [Candidatus Peribacteria bacterium]